MQEVSARECEFTVLKKGAMCISRPLPYLRAFDGDKVMYNLGPNHGRSYVVGRCGDKYVVSKGNGLSYSQYVFWNSGEFGDDTLGLLLRQDAIRDFVMGQEIASLSIKTNRMEYVLELDEIVTLTNGHQQKPVLLQYAVECPYRICDAPFMTRRQITDEVTKWKGLTGKGYNEAHMTAADILIRNLWTLHDNGILHNAIHNQNYTWALELLDFELACSPQHPYDNEDERRHVKDLFSREIMQTYEIIKYIAWCLGEKIDDAEIDCLFQEYDFDLSEFRAINTSQWSGQDG